MPVMTENLIARRIAARRRRQLLIRANISLIVINIVLIVVTIIQHFN